MRQICDLEPTEIPIFKSPIHNLVSMVPIKSRWLFFTYKSFVKLGKFKKWKKLTVKSGSITKSVSQSSLPNCLNIGLKEAKIRPETWTAPSWHWSVTSQCRSLSIISRIVVNRCKVCCSDVNLQVMFFLRTKGISEKCSTSFESPSRGQNKTRN